MNNSIQTQLLDLIHSQELSIRGAAELIGMDNSNLSKILRGKEGLTIERAERIANALGGSLSIKVEKIAEKVTS